MRKTILSMVLVLFAIGAITANEKVTNDQAATTIMVEDFAGINSFCKAIVQGDLDTVRKLIALGEDVNQKSLGKTPAIFAARYNRAEILKVLVLNGANVKIKCDQQGFDAKKYAEMSNATEALKVIEEVLQS
ncbi:MAG: ankyrin repeat domain-containing protein [Aurantibacter sp.]